MIGLLSGACDSPGPLADGNDGAASRDAPVQEAGTATLTGTAPEAAQGARSVVILRPYTPIDVRGPTTQAEMDQFGREFIPRLLLVRRGQTVRFKNSEDDLHTVHVTDDDGESLFNVAMPIRGGIHDHTFAELGEYAVSCDAHPEMAATIIVVDTPYTAVADRDGSFTIDRVRPGTYDLILRRGPQRHEQPIDISAGRTEITLDFPP